MKMTFPDKQKKKKLKFWKNPTGFHVTPGEILSLKKKKSLRVTWVHNVQAKALRHRAKLTARFQALFFAPRSSCILCKDWPWLRRDARDNVVSDACVTFPIPFSCKIKLKPAELSKHLGLIRANLWFPQKNLLIFKEVVIPPLAIPWPPKPLRQPKQVIWVGNICLTHTPHPADWGLPSCCSKKEFH